VPRASVSFTLLDPRVSLAGLAISTGVPERLHDQRVSLIGVAIKAVGAALEPIRRPFSEQLEWIGDLPVLRVLFLSFCIGALSRGQGVSVKAGWRQTCAQIDCELFWKPLL